MFYSAFQTNAFWRKSYQIGNNDNAEQNTAGFVYHSPYSDFKRKEAKREEIRKEKTELEKLESVLREAERKKALATANKLLAKKAQALRLANLENEYLEEINRLLKLRGELVQRIRRNEEDLLIMLIISRRKLRVSLTAS